MVQQLRDDLEKLKAREAESEQDQQQRLSTLESEKQEQLAELETKHDALVQKLTQQKTQLQADLKHAQGVNSRTDDKRETAIRMLTQQRLQLEADLTKARATTDQHEPEIHKVTQHSVQLEADLKKVKDDKEVVDDQLVKTNLELAETDEKLDAAEQKLKQAEQQASKAAKTIRAQEKLVSQLRGEATNLKEEIDYLKNSGESSRSLIDENSRLKRESRLAHDRFAKVQKENAELQGRLMYYALGVEDNDSGHIHAVTPDAMTDGQHDREERTRDAEASETRDGLHNIKLDADSAATETDTFRPPVEFPRPKSFRPRTHERRRSTDFGEHNRPIPVASPVVNLPVPSQASPV